jgi:cytochrome oxidase Cu insertion factor (SCO1/SenC/PrrC family)
MRVRQPVLAAALWLAVMSAAAHEPPQRSAAQLMDILMWNREPIGGPFELTDHHGKRRTDKDFRGKMMLVYFGFTSCVDVCPTDLQNIGLALEKLGAAGKVIQPLFITVDPDRDTPQRLAAYVPSFHPTLIGLSGSAADVRRAADAYRVYYKRLPQGQGSVTGYEVDHSAAIYLMDRNGKYIDFLPPRTPAGRMAESLRRVLAVQQ